MLSGLVFSCPVAAQDRFADLLKQVPGSANSLMVIDAQALLASPLATANGWRDKHEAAYVKKPMVLPPEADRLVIASLISTNREFAQDWELGVMSLTEPMSMKSIARLEGGYVDQIDGLDVAWTPSDAYFVSLSPKQLSVMYPADRQTVSRWATAARDGKTGLSSPYLQQAVGAVAGSTQIVLALDLKDVVQPHRLREGLTAYTGDAAKIEPWVKLITGIQGVTLRVAVTNSAKGTLRIDFASSAAVLGDDAKPLVLAALEKHGALLDDFNTWTARLDGNAIVMQGDLSESGMRHVFSLLELPTSKFSSVSEASLGSSGSMDAVAKASRTYFASISTLLDDLRHEFETSKDARSTQGSLYMDRYARRIDRLPILNVDEDLLAYGANVAETLRDASVSSKMSGVRTGVRKSQVYGNYAYEYDDNGYYAARSTSSIKTQITREEQAAAKSVRFNNWKEIEDATAAIRQSMTGKYMIQF